VRRGAGSHLEAEFDWSVMCRPLAHFGLANRTDECPLLKIADHVRNCVAYWRPVTLHALRCKNCSQVRGYPYKRSHLVALRTTKISTSDPPSTWWPGER
jgi:hypothetical protein